MIIVSHSIMSDSLGPVEYSPPGSSVQGILQAKILEWVAVAFSRGSSQPRDWTCVSRIAGRFFTGWATKWGSLSLIRLSTVSRYTVIFFNTNCVTTKGGPHANNAQHSIITNSIFIESRHLHHLLHCVQNIWQTLIVDFFPLHWESSSGEPVRTLWPECSCK